MRILTLKSEFCNRKFNIYSANINKYADKPKFWVVSYANYVDASHNSAFKAKSVETTEYSETAKSSKTFTLHGKSATMNVLQIVF